MNGWLDYLRAGHRKAEGLYDLTGDRMLIADSSVPLANMGYWADVDEAAPDSLEQANMALFDLVSEAAGPPRAGALVVDVGSGFGVNATRIAARTGATVVGVNRSRVQLQMSRARAEEAGLSERVHFVRADAGHLPFADGSVDHVLCVEAAFHFEAPERFFADVARVLSPTGRLSMADLLPLPPRGALDRLAWRFTRSGLSIPDANVRDPERYRAGLEGAGLRVETFRSIVDDVYPPFRRWQLSQPLSSLMQLPKLMAVSSAGFLVYPWDYVHVVAGRA